MTNKNSTFLERLYKYAPPSTTANAEYYYIYYEFNKALKYFGGESGLEGQLISAAQKFLQYEADKAKIQYSKIPNLKEIEKIISAASKTSIDYNEVRAGVANALKYLKKTTTGQVIYMEKFVAHVQNLYKGLKKAKGLADGEVAIDVKEAAEKLDKLVKKYNLVKELNKAKSKRPNGKSFRTVAESGTEFGDFITEFKSTFDTLLKSQSATLGSWGELLVGDALVKATNKINKQLLNTTGLNFTVSQTGTSKTQSFDPGILGYAKKMSLKGNNSQVDITADVIISNNKSSAEIGFNIKSWDSKQQTRGGQFQTLLNTSYANVVNYALHQKTAIHQDLLNLVARNIPFMAEQKSNISNAGRHFIGATNIRNAIEGKTKLAPGNVQFIVINENYFTLADYYEKLSNYRPVANSIRVVMPPGFQKKNVRLPKEDSPKNIFWAWERSKQLTNTLNTSVARIVGPS